MPTARPPSDATLLVACLCADWCGTCREYQPLFATLQTQFADVRFLWVDVEDEADLVDPIEVENFPTILIATPSQVLFFGTVTPHLQTLQRLIESQRTDSPRPLPASPELDGLRRRLWQHTPAAL